MRERLNAARRAFAKKRGAIPRGGEPLVLFGLLMLVPQVSYFDNPWLVMFFLVGLYAVLGFGLNVVVGFAGLLDLGYVAFFAAGAYALAILSSYGSPLHINLSFWLVIPMAVGIGALIGVLLGLPVLPLRGDYLAIVTLGFGEIIRIVLTNSEGLTNGAQGISAISTPSIVVRDIGLDKEVWYYFIVIAAFAVAIVTMRLRDARVGRAWEAIREDEDVAAAMGIDVVRYKLMAFATGAAIGAFGGAIYASFYGFINPSAFSLQVSIDVLAVVIIGGMGSIRGVVFGAFILKGIPELLQFKETADLLERLGWLRDGINRLVDGVNTLTAAHIGDLPPADTWGQEIADRRFIIFGALLVAIMILRPAGLFPSRRRQLEFAGAHEADDG